MKNVKYILLAAAAYLCLMVAGCSKSNDQKQFENEAYSQPANYTMMNANGQHEDSGPNDPDDWRISPMYRGLIDIETRAYPNPVFINSSFRILIALDYITNLSRIEAYVFQTSFSEDGTGPVDTIGSSEISEGSLPTLVISPSAFPRNKINNLYRIILFDQGGNVITYGDIKVEE